MPRPSTGSKPTTLKIPQTHIELLKLAATREEHYTDVIRTAVRQYLRGRGHQLEHTAWIWYRWRRELVCPTIGARRIEPMRVAS